MYAAAFGKKKFFEPSNEESSVERKLSLRAKRNLAIMDEINKLIGDDIPWVNEEEMIRELAEMRRRNSKS